jgi:hypothetical protein
VDSEQAKEYDSICRLDRMVKLTMLRKRAVVPTVGKMEAATPKKGSVGRAQVPPKSSPEILKRNAIVDQNTNMTAGQLCKQFDFQRISLPGRWFEQCNVKRWVEAYRIPQLRKRIDTMISKTRARLA